MDMELVDRIVDKHHGEASSLIQVLLEIQAENHWLPKEALERVSERLHVPMSRIRHIATFYKAFSLVPRGRHEVHVCMGTACHVRGSRLLLDQALQQLGVKAGEVTPDGLFSVESVNCLGACALGPIVKENEIIHHHMTPGKLRRLIETIRRRETEGKANA